MTHHWAKVDGNDDVALFCCVLFVCGKALKLEVSGDDRCCTQSHFTMCVSEHKKMVMLLGNNGKQK